ncbi:hypothetical protein EGW08_009299 [Elysia chlorotica]|uniref:Uncharacterized protein n=1 Tax=Elysia chlorotica TaxID=188477 RepID=A0A3S1B9H2_ELYCH|nr:hypothetical protein EGW08_009299 [Elysia chlorotica]
MSCDAESCPLPTEVSADSTSDGDSNNGRGGRKLKRQNKQQQNEGASATAAVSGDDNSADVDDDDNNNNNNEGDDSDDSSGGRRRRRNRVGDDDDEDDDDEFIWEQELGLGSPVMKSALVPKNKGIIIVQSKDDALEDFGFEQSTTIYDYSTGSSVVAIQPKGRGPCFLLEESLTYPEIMNGVKQLNGTVAARSDQVSLDGIGTPLSNEDQHVMFTSHPEVKQVCGRGHIIVLAEPGDLPPYNGAVKEIKVLIYDAELTITVPVGRRAATAAKRLRSRIRNGSSGQINFAGSSQRKNETSQSARYSWRQGLPSGRSVEKSVIVKSGDSIITVESIDSNLSNYGINASITTYDFTTATGVVVMRTVSRGPCYLTDEALSYREIVDEAAKLNGTFARPTAVQWNLPWWVSDRSRFSLILFRTNPALRLPCGLRAIIPTVEPTASTSYNGTTTKLEFLTFDGQITIIARSG